MSVFLGFTPHAEKAPWTINCILPSIEKFLLIYILQDINMPTKPADILFF